MQELADAPSGDPKILEVRKFLAESDFDQLENTWMDLVGGDEPITAERVAGLVDVATSLLDQGMSSRAGPLLEMLAPAAESASGVSSETLLAVSELLVRANPRNRDYLSAYVDRFQETHGPTTAERAFFTAAEVAESADPARALERYRSLTRFRPGTVVFHESGWGIGEVLAVDALLGQVKVDLAEKKDHRIAISAVDAILEVLPDDSLRAMLYHGGEELSRLAAEDPLALIEKTLDDAGNPAPQKELKARLVPAVMDAKSWTKWWGQTKRRLRESGYYRVGDRAPYTVEKLEDQVSFEDDLLQRFSKGEWADMRTVARTVLKGGAKKFPGAYSAVCESLVAMGAAETDAARAIEIYSLLARHDAVENGNELLGQTTARFPISEVNSAIAALPVGEDLDRVLDAVRLSRQEDWIQIATAAFTGRTDSLRRAACDLLEKEAPSEIRALSAEICASPRRSPDAYCWLLEQRLKDQSRPSLEILAQRTPRGLLVLLLDLLEHLVDKEVREGRNAVKDLYRRVEDLAYFKKGEFFREAVAIMESPERYKVHKILVRNQDNLQKCATKLLEIIGALEPVIAEKDEVPAWRDEGVIFTTEVGLERKREELRVLQEEKLPAIFKAIGDAAELGDLSENAEFTSAIEERDNLVRKAEQVQDDLDKVVLIESSMSQSAAIGVGSTIRVENLDSGQQLTYSVLGPWDGTPEEGVLNYRSPLGQCFLGRQVGEEVDVVLPGRTDRYRILECAAHA